MQVSKHEEAWVAAILVLPVVILFCLIFLYPVGRMVMLSFTNAPLIGDGDWVGLDNYIRQLSQPLFRRAVVNTLTFIALTVVPGTLLALLIALGVSRLKGWLQAFVLVCFFLPTVLPVSVVTNLWAWMANLQYGILQPVFVLFTGGRPLPVFRSGTWFLPMIAIVTIWWTIGFKTLLFIAALKNIPAEIYEAAALDNAGRWRVFRRITWPLIWPVTALVLTLALIAEFKIFSQAYILAQLNSTPPNDRVVIMRLIYDLAFTQNKGGEGAAVATMLFILIIALSLLLSRLFRTRKTP